MYVHVCADTCVYTYTCADVNAGTHRGQKMVLGPPLPELELQKVVSCLM